MKVPKKRNKKHSKSARRGATKKRKDKPSSRSFEERLTPIERFVSTFATRSMKTSALATLQSAVQPAAVGALVDVELTKDGKSPDLVRITLDPTLVEVLAPGAKKGSIANVAVGSFLGINVEVTGNPGATASIAVKSAITGDPDNPHTITVKLPLNTGQVLEPRSLLVTG